MSWLAIYAIIFYAASTILFLLVVLLFFTYFLKFLAVYRKILFDLSQLILLFAVIIFLFSVATKDPIDLGGVPFELSGSTAIAVYLAWIGFSVKNLDKQISELKEDLRELKRETKAEPKDFSTWKTK